MTIPASITALPVALDISINHYEMGQLAQQDAAIPQAPVAEAMAAEARQSAPPMVVLGTMLPIHSGSEDITTAIVYAEATANVVESLVPLQRVLLVEDAIIASDEENAFSSVDSEYITISVFKPRKRTPMGLTFVDDSANPGLVRVTQINTDSPFRSTPLAEGDVVMAINQVQARSARVASRVVQASEQWLTVAIHRSANSKSGHVTTFLRKQVVHQRLGIQFLVDPTDDALLVWKVEGSGLLAHTSLLKVADVVLRVNNSVVRTPDEAMAALNTNPQHVRLETRTEGGVVLVLTQRAPLPQTFWYKCVGLFVMLVVVMFVVFYFARSENDCQPFCESLEKFKEEQAANEALNNDDQ